MLCAENIDGIFKLVAELKKSLTAEYKNLLITIKNNPTSLLQECKAGRTKIANYFNSLQQIETFFNQKNMAGTFFYLKIARGIASNAANQACIDSAKLTELNTAIENQFKK